MAQIPSSLSAWDHVAISDITLEISREWRHWSEQPGALSSALAMWVSVPERSLTSPGPALVTGVKLISSSSSPPQPIPGPTKSAHQLYPRVPGRRNQGLITAQPPFTCYIAISGLFTRLFMGFKSLTLLAAVNISCFGVVYPASSK